VLSCSADQEYSSTLGINVRRVNLIILVLLCISVVMLLRVTGLIMVMALLSIPADIARSHCRTLAGTMIAAGVISLLGLFGGMFIAVQTNLTPGAVIVALLAAMYMVNIFLPKK
jgi:zinc transport system permease protein